MNCSVIYDSRVRPDKGGWIGQCDEEVTEATLDEIARVMLACHSAPAIFKDHKRNKSSLISIDYLCFDFDEGSLSKVIREDCVTKQWNHLILASKNHLKDKGDGKGIIERFHLFLPVKQPITDAEFYSYAVRTLGKMMGWNIDKAATDCSRYFYRHSSILYKEERFNNLNLDWIKDMQIKEQETKKINKDIATRIFTEKINAYVSGSNIDKANLTPLNIFEHTKIYKEMVSGILQYDGERYNLSNKLIGTMLKCGMHDSEIIDMFDKHSTYGNGFIVKVSNTE